MLAADHSYFQMGNLWPVIQYGSCHEKRSEQKSSDQPAHPYSIIIPGKFYYGNTLESLGLFKSLLHTKFGQSYYSLKLRKLAWLVPNSFSRVKAHHDATLVVFWMKFPLLDCILNSPSLDQTTNALADKSLHLALRILHVHVRFKSWNQYVQCFCKWDFCHALSKVVTVWTQIRSQQNVGT